MIPTAELVIQKDSYTKKEMHYLFSRFAEGAKAARNMPAVEEVFFSLKDNKGKLQGGIQGYYFYGSGMVDMLWVEAPYRKKDYGYKLMQAFEAYVKSRGATFMTVSTMDWWDVVPFYQSMGYEIEFTREGYANRSKQYSLRKDLTKGCK